MKTLVKKREDYKPLFWIPKKTFLDIYVYEDFTIVKSEILFNKNEFSIIEKYNLENVIELNGVNLETLVQDITYSVSFGNVVHRNNSFGV